MHVTRFLLSLARRSWIASALCVVVCAGFAARAAANVFEAEYLAEPTAVPVPPAAPVAPPLPVVVDPGKASALVDRNVFCSDCPAQGAGDPLPTVAIPARSSLELVATSLGDRPSESYATLVDATSGTQGAYWIGQRVSGIGTLEKVAGTYVLVRNDAGAVERVELGRGPKPTEPAAKPAKIAAVAATPDAAAPAWAARVNKLDDQTYEVDRQLIRDLMNAGAKLPGVKVMPAMSKDGKLAGVRVAQARKDSLAAGLGLKNGDLVQAIDGTALDSTDAMLEMYGRLDSASVTRVSIVRGGKPVELEYRLR